MSRDEEEEAGAGGAQAPGHDAGPEGEAERGWWRWRGWRQARRNWGEFIISSSDLTELVMRTMLIVFLYFLTLNFIFQASPWVLDRLTFDLFNV